MRASLVPLCLVLGLGGCQTAPPHAGSPSEQRTVLHPGDAVVSVIATPFYLAFKGIACGASVLVAAPVAGLAAVSESRFAPAIQEDLGDGLSRNCGPPHALSPYRVVAAEPTPAPPDMPEPSSSSTSVPEAPASPRPLIPAAGPPDTPAPPQPPDHPPVPTIEEVPKAASRGPIELFNP